MTPTLALFDTPPAPETPVEEVAHLHADTPCHSAPRVALASLAALALLVLLGALGLG